MEEKEPVKCDCGNNKFYASVEYGRGVLVFLVCTECGKEQFYGGG